MKNLLVIGGAGYVGNEIIKYKNISVSLAKNLDAKLLLRIHNSAIKRGFFSSKKLIP